MSSQVNSLQAPLRFVLLTGKPGIGKSTLVKKVCSALAEKDIKTWGFYTEEVRHGGPRIGFDVVTLDDSRCILARITDDSSGSLPRVGKYSVHLKSFEDLVIPLFTVASSHNSVLVIDEIGRMEMFSQLFCREVKLAFSKPQTILATVPVGNNTFVKHLQSLPQAKTFEVNHMNRNALLEPVVEILVQSLSH